MATLDINIDKPPIPTGLTLWVDSVNGNDGTGLRGRQDRPFLTLTAAKNAASAGDLVHVRPGLYSVSTTLCKNGVNWHGDPGAVITMTNGTGQGIFDDDGLEVVSVVTGAFDLITTDDGSGFTRTYGIVCPRNPSSILRVECNSMVSECPEEDPGLNACVWQFDGNVYVRCASMFGTYANALYWENGEMFVDCPLMKTLGTVTIATLTDSVPTGKMWVNGMEIVSDSSEAISITGANADTQVWIQALEIRGDGETSNGVNASSAGKNYVNAQKITGGNSGSAVYVTQGTSWIVAEKISGGSASGDAGLVTVNAGKLFLETQHVDPLSTDRGIVVIGGSLVMTGGQMAINGYGLDIRGGSVILSGVSIDASASNTSSPIVKSGGTLELNGCVLNAEATQPSIAASTAQTVTAVGTKANTDVDANVTVTGDMQIESTATAGQVPTAKADGTWEWGSPLDVNPSFLTYTGGTVVNNTVTPANIDSSADLNIPGAGMYEFEFVIDYTSAAAATGAGFDLGNSTCPQNYLSYAVFGDTGTGDRSVLQWSVYGTNAPFISSRAAAPTALTAIIQGTVNATGAGNIRIRFRSEIAASAITITDVRGYFRRLA